MNARQAAFVREYLIDKNGKQAAIRAGYKSKHAAVTASELLTNPKVSVAVTEGLQALADQAGITAARVMQELTSLATVDLRSFYDQQGNLKRMHELTPEQGAALAGVETLKRNMEAGDGEMETVYKIKIWDKPRSLEMLAKHFGLLSEKLELSGTVAYKWLD